MVILKLQGGLGNQMFQYAAARNIAKSKPPILDLSFINHNTKSSAVFTSRKFELGIFKNLACNNIPFKMVSLIVSHRVTFKVFRLFFLKNPLYVDDSNLNINNDIQKNYYLDGYFQDYKILENQRSELLAEFTFPPLPNDQHKIREEIQGACSVSLHVRRGDYLKPKIKEFHGLVPMEYYHKAIKHINTQLKQTHYYIFSDDIEWCINEFDFIDNKTFISHNGASWIDMYLMSLCKHNIIANSSFSWWGAWLNQYPEKIVIAPKNWFSLQETKIIPKEWICL